MYVHIQKNVVREIMEYGLVELLGALAGISGLGSTEQGGVHW